MCARFKFATVCLAVAAMAVSAHAGVYSIGADPGDYEALDNGTVSNGVSGALRVGSRTLITATPTAACPLLPFALPALQPGEVITGATLSILTKAQTTYLPVANADLYGLPFNAAPLEPDAAWYFAGASDATAGVTLLQDNFLVPVDAETEARHVSVDISSYIQSLYSAGAAAGDFALLRLSYDQVPDLAAHNRYLVWSRQATSTSDNSDTRWPYLEITTVPEPASLGLLLLGVSGLVARRRR